MIEESAWPLQIALLANFHIFNTMATGCHSVEPFINITRELVSAPVNDVMYIETSSFDIYSPLTHALLQGDFGFRKFPKNLASTIFLNKVLSNMQIASTLNFALLI